MKTLCLLALSLTGLTVVGYSAQRVSKAAGGGTQAAAASTNSTANAQVRERAKVQGTDDVVTFFKDGTAELVSEGKTVRGAYRPG